MIYINRKKKKEKEEIWIFERESAGEKGERRRREKRGK
jgi:hypothetical protein